MRHGIKLTKQSMNLICKGIAPEYSYSESLLLCKSIEVSKFSWKAGVQILKVSGGSCFAYTPYLSEFFVFYEKNLLLLNLVSRSVTSPSQLLLKVKSSCYSVTKFWYQWIRVFTDQIQVSAIGNFAGWNLFIWWWILGEDCVWPFEPFLKLKATFCKYLTSIKIKISTTCLYKEYEIEKNATWAVTKAENEVSLFMEGREVITSKLILSLPTPWISESYIKI